MNAQPALSFTAAFERVLGAEALDALRAGMSTRPVVLISGDQLTGKSTAAKAVAQALGGLASGTGSEVRRLAKERGIAVEDMAKALVLEPDIDVQLDYRAAKLVASGEVSSFESRLAGQLGLFLRKLGRKGVVTTYLECKPRERALRYIAREFDAGARSRIEPLLRVADGADLTACLAALAPIDDPVARAVTTRFQDVAERDERDRCRLRGVYGIDYRDTSIFDLIIDTSDKKASEVQAAILRRVLRSDGADE